MQQSFATRWNAAPLWQKIAAGVGALLLVGELLPSAMSTRNDPVTASTALMSEPRTENAADRSARIAAAIEDDCGGPKNGINLLALYPEWSDDVLVGASCGNVVIGMSTDQVREAWGEPADINRMTTGSGVSEQWIYRARGGYVYLDDGVVTAIQE